MGSQGEGSRQSIPMLTAQQRPPGRDYDALGPGGTLGLECRAVLLLSGETGQQVRSRGQSGVQQWAEEQFRVAPYHPSRHLFA